ncbi:uncharacterized protein UDID_06685 [Ustilago sp. UG-2017a]|nr:uncharacterized protein UDID_06685 [Ustilago sp. UG-2017a]
MPFSPKPHTLFTAPGRRRKSLATATATAEVEVEETLSSTISPHVHFSHTHGGLQPSASASWINPFSSSHALPRASVDEDSLYQPPSSGSQPSSRRPSAATIISTLLHGVTGVRMSQDGPGGYTSSEESGGTNPHPQTHTPPTASSGVRRPSALFKAWKSRRGSATTATTQQAQVAAVGGRRKCSALTGFLPTSTLARGGGVGRVEKHSLPPSSTRASSSDDTRRRGARGEAVTAAMAIRDTWLYSSHQYSKDGRKGSVSTVATSPSCSQHLPRKSFSGVGTVGLHMENDERQQRVKGMRKEAGADADSVVSLSLTEEIALYTTDDRNRRSADSSSSTAQSSRYSPPKGIPGAGEGGMGGMTWNMPNWNTAAPMLPELSPAPSIMIADPFAKAPPLSVVAGREMQRVESGSLDPVLSPIPASSPSLENGDGEEQAGLQWDTTSPFTPSLNHRPSMSK